MKFTGVRMPMNPDEIKNEYLSGVYQDMAEVIGIDSVLKIHQSFRGQTVCFPVDLFNRHYIACQIIKEYDGHNIKKLASKFGYSEKWIRKILKDSGNRNE